MLYRILTIAMVLACSSWAGSWTKGVALSSGGEGWEASAGIDAAGNSVAVWVERTTKGLVQDRVWSKTRPNGGTWSAKTVVSRANPSLQTTYVYPALRVSAAGNATAVWGDVDGLWTADRPAAGPWNPAQLLMAGLSTPLFVMNTTGDAVLVWGTGGPSAGASTVVAMRRVAGGAWGAPQTLATATHAGADSVALSDNGDVVVTWETYDSSGCPDICRSFNFVLHASRQAAGAQNWQDSGPIVGPDPAGHYGLVALDAAGNAAVVYSTAAGTLVAVNQHGTGQPWSQPAPVYSGSTFYPVGFATDAAGNATLVFLNTSAAGSVMAVSGSVPDNTWGAARAISGTDQSPNQVLFAVGSNGAALTVWAAGNPSYSNNTIRASVRSGPNAAWSTPVSLGRTSLGGPESAAINAAGKALVIYSSFPGVVGSHTEYAVNYTP